MSETPDIRPRVCMRIRPAELVAARRVADRGPVVDGIDSADEFYVRDECAQCTNAQLAAGATHELARKLQERGGLIVATTERAAPTSAGDHEAGSFRLALLAPRRDFDSEIDVVVLALAANAKRQDFRTFGGLLSRSRRKRTATAHRRLAHLAARNAAALQNRYLWRPRDATKYARVAVCLRQHPGVPRERAASRLATMNAAVVSENPVRPSVHVHEHRRTLRPPSLSLRTVTVSRLHQTGSIRAKRDGRHLHGAVVAGCGGTLPSRICARPPEARWKRVS
jgi:hypothetical protein